MNKQEFLTTVNVAQDFRSDLNAPSTAVNSSFLERLIGMVTFPGTTEDIKKTILQHVHTVVEKTDAPEVFEAIRQEMTFHETLYKIANNQPKVIDEVTTYQNR